MILRSMQSLEARTYTTPSTLLILFVAFNLAAQPELHVVDQLRIGEDPSFPTVYGELKHEGGSNGFKINANANGSWADLHFQTDGITRMFVESGGNIGIGLTNPLTKLQVLGSKSNGAVGHFTNIDASADASGVHGESYAISGAGRGGYFRGGKIGASGEVFPDVSANHAYFGFFGQVETMQTVEGSGLNYGVYGYALRGAKNYGLYGSAWGGSGATENYGVYGQAIGTGINYAGYFNGDVTITGNLSKGSGSFQIDHPLDPENKYLFHSFVESPDMINLYNGNTIMNAAGEAVVELPDYFESLNGNFRYQLTCIGGWAPIYIAEEISGNQFKIAGGEAGMKVSWQVTGVRQDAFARAHRIKVEVDKSDGERGKYLHPEAFGKSRILGVNYPSEQEIKMKAGQE